MSRDSRPMMILVTGEPVASALAARGTFADFIRATTGPAWGGEWLEVDLRTAPELPEPERVAGIIVTGSASSVTERAPWILRGEEYLRGAVRRLVPTFGLCFGHQMLASALGGEVGKNPAGREIGTVPVETFGSDPLFQGMGATSKANATHVDTVVRLSPGAEVLASTERERHAALRFGEAAWGVQYHPEFDADVMRHYVATRRDLIAAEGLDADGIFAAIEDTPESAALLRRFAAIVQRGCE